MLLRTTHRLLRVPQAGVSHSLPTSERTHVVQGNTLQRKAIPALEIIITATSCRALPQETCLTGLR